MITKQNTVVRIDANNTEGNLRFYVYSKKAVSRFSIMVSGIDGSYVFKYTPEREIFTAEGKIDNPRLWSIASPNLYSYEVQLDYSDKDREIVCGKFAFRTLSCDEKNIYLNGKPLFIKGYIRGATAHEHSNNCRLPLIDFYRKNIIQAKRFGFNFIRFHSVVPPEELFQAADELGMLIHIEFRKPNDSYNNLEEMLFAKRALVPKEFIEENINRLYEHPSLAEYCIGNELKTAPVEEIVALGAYIKLLDSSRIFIDTCAWGKLGRENVDIDVQHMSYYFPYGKHADMFNDAGSIHTLKDDGIECKQGVSPYPVPLLAHEVCHYTALRDFKGLKAKFKKYNVPEPWWIEEELKMIKAKGLEGVFDKMYLASKYFQQECWKTAFEKIRSSRILSGYHFLQFADTDVYENSNGIVDCFDDENAISPTDFLRFSGDRVLLTELGYRSFRMGTTVTLPVNFSNYGEEDIEKADLICTLKCGEGEVYRTVVENLDISEKGFIELTKVKVKFPVMPYATKLQLTFELNCGEKSCCENRWNVWVYPEYDKMTYKQFTSYRDGEVAITSDIAQCLKLLKEGKRVCLVYRSAWTRHVADKTQNPPDYAFKATWNRFKPVIWDRGTNYGGFCNGKLLRKYNLFDDEYYDFSLSLITEDCDKIILDDFPCDVDAILTGIDKCTRDRFDAYKVGFNLPELMYDRTLRKFAYLFSLNVGEGKLLVCGLNLTGLDECEPSAQGMANFILNYIKSNDFASQNGITVERLEEYLKECAKAPVKERMMTQFWELDDAPVESKTYWEESRAYLK